MGNHFYQQRKLEQDFKTSLKLTKAKFAKIEKRRILFIGPSGKNALLIFRRGWQDKPLQGTSGRAY